MLEYHEIRGSRGFAAQRLRPTWLFWRTAPVTRSVLCLQDYAWGKLQDRQARNPPFQQCWKRQKCHYFTYGSFMFYICFLCSRFIWHCLTMFDSWNSDRRFDMFDMDIFTFARSRKKATFQEVQAAMWCDTMWCNGFDLRVVECFFVM